MKYFRVLAVFVAMALVLGLFIGPAQVEAGKKKMLKKAALAALMLKGGKRILLPLPIPIPIPFLKQKEPVYYPQQQYSSSSSY